VDYISYKKGKDRQRHSRRWLNMKVEVLCNVQNCKYWANGDKCVADSIYVIGHHGREAEDVYETACKTFDEE
jgi:hypothetical protein